MPITRCHIAGFTDTVFNMFEFKGQVSLRCHKLNAVANGKTVFDNHFSQLTLALTGQLTNKLLTIRHGVTIGIVLIFIMYMTT